MSSSYNTALSRTTFTYHSTKESRSRALNPPQNPDSLPRSLSACRLDTNSGHVAGMRTKTANDSALHVWTHETDELWSMLWSICDTVRSLSSCYVLSNLAWFRLTSAVCYPFCSPIAPYAAPTLSLTTARSKTIIDASLDVLESNNSKSGVIADSMSITLHDQKHFHVLHQQHFRRCECAQIYCNRADIAVPGQYQTTNR